MIRPDTGLHSAKRRVRKECRRAVSSLTESGSLRLKAEETWLLRALQEHPVLRKAPAVCSFLSFGTEINLDELNKALMAGGIVVYVPVIIGGSPPELEFRVLPSDTRSLKMNRWGIREPHGTPVLDPSASPAVRIPMIVPGLAFDPEGHRLGKGGGYYDRYLSLYPKRFYTIGTGFSVQLIPNVPAGERDIRMDEICIPPAAAGEGRTS
ncbi:MAG: 5-formyltetrahydrofolate cyclo-ligase [Spirochaetales bacterium]|nr:5-formyltetrahydrofolate cyclo-ligase [Spirochaetales bacterium]